MVERYNDVTVKWIMMLQGNYEVASFNDDLAIVRQLPNDCYGSFRENIHDATSLGHRFDVNDYL